VPMTGPKRSLRHRLPEIAMLMMDWAQVPLPKS